MKLTPENYMIYNDRGNARHLSGDFKGAIDDFNKAITLHPDYPSALNNLAVSLSGNKDDKTAMETFNKIINLNSEFGIAYLNRGQLKELQGDIGGACADWKTAEKLGITEATGYLKEYQK